MAAQNQAVRVEGLSDLLRDLGKINRDLRTDALRHIRDVANIVRDDARRRAPKRTGRLSRSVKASVRQSGASIYSSLPYAPIVEFGGDISPRGVTIHFEPRPFMGDSVDAHTDDIEEQIGDLLDGIALRQGFRP